MKSRRRKIWGLVLLLLCFGMGGCAEQARKRQETPSGEASMERTCQEHVHRMSVQWFGEAPNCTHGGYQMAICTLCGWVDEEACGEVAALAHTPAMYIRKQGNCKEDTVIVYECTACGEQSGYERHPEPDKHCWITGESVFWDERIADFVTRQVIYCELCGIQRAEEE